MALISYSSACFFFFCMHGFHRWKIFSSIAMFFCSRESWQLHGKLGDYPGNMPSLEVLYAISLKIQLLIKEFLRYHIAVYNKVNYLFRNSNWLNDTQTYVFIKDYNIKQSNLNEIERISSFLQKIRQLIFKDIGN